jgi:cytochrome c biogenesis protein CcmG, thiol:disulfide interchange protein DsbE
MPRRALLVAQGAAVGLVALLFALLVWKLVSGSSGALAAQVARGEEPAAPDFTASRVDRQGELTLSDLRGKAVLVNFFASWCRPACTLEAPELEQTWRTYRRSGLVVLGVDWQDLRSDARGFMREFSLTYPVVYDGPGSIGNRYGITGLPETYVVGRNGLVVAAIVGSINTDADRARLKRAVKRALRT